MARSCTGVGQAAWCLAQGSGRPELTAKGQPLLREREPGVVTEQAGQGLASQCPVSQDPSESNRVGLETAVRFNQGLESSSKFAVMRRVQGPFRKSVRIRIGGR